MFEEQLLGPETTQTSSFISSTPSPLTKEIDSINNMAKYDYDKVPIVDIVNEIILDSIKRNASDIHFDPYENGIQIRLRIDGDLHNYSVVPLTMKKNMITRIKIIANMNITESRLPQDGAVKGTIEDTNVDLRVSCLPTNMGEKIVVRILDYSRSSSGLESLGFTKENLESVKKMISIPNGIILVTGATGSGKSTTVYSILQRLNTENRNLITVEDPIEMNIEGINQVQVNSEIGMTFASALRSILRQDPDIIMIGEIRDSETARIAVRSAITGHLVLSTIHTNDSLNTIERLLDMDVERYLLGAAISGIISQKLARKLCPRCRKLRPTTEYEQRIFKLSLGLEVNEIYEAEGCSLCSGGYKGRVPIHEVLLINQEIKDAISSGLPKVKLRELVFSDSSHIITMLQDGLTKILTGDTSLDEILRLVQLDDEVMNSYEGLDKTNLDSGKEEKTSEEKVAEEESVKSEVKASIDGKTEDLNKEENAENLKEGKDENSVSLDNLERVIEVSPEEKVEKNAQSKTQEKIQNETEPDGTNTEPNEPPKAEIVEPNIEEIRKEEKTIISEPAIAEKENDTEANSSTVKDEIKEPSENENVQNDTSLSPTVEAAQVDENSSTDNQSREITNVVETGGASKQATTSEIEETPQQLSVSTNDKEATLNLATPKSLSTATDTVDSEPNEVIENSDINEQSILEKIETENSNDTIKSETAAEEKVQNEDLNEGTQSETDIAESEKIDENSTAVISDDISENAEILADISPTKPDEVVEVATEEKVEKNAQPETREKIQNETKPDGTNTEPNEPPKAEIVEPNIEEIRKEEKTIVSEPAIAANETAMEANSSTAKDEIKEPSENENVQNDVSLSPTVEAIQVDENSSTDNQSRETTNVVETGGTSKQTMTSEIEEIPQQQTVSPMVDEKIKTEHLSIDTEKIDDLTNIVEEARRQEEVQTAENSEEPIEEFKVDDDFLKFSPNEPSKVENFTENEYEKNELETFTF